MKTIILIEGQKIDDVFWHNHLENLAKNLANKRYVKIKNEEDEISLDDSWNKENEFFSGRRSKFVGFLQDGDALIISLPKYLKKQITEPKVMDSEDKGIQNEITDKQITMLMNLFRLYTGKIRYEESHDELFFKCVENGRNRFSMADKVIEQYNECGLYVAARTVTSNKGRISWGETIKRVKPLISGDDPIYTMYIKKRNIHQENLVTDIQKAALAYARKMFGLTELSDIVSPSLTFGQILGKQGYYQRILRRERNIVNKDSDIRIIDGLIKLIAGESIRKDENSVYAISNFELIFEKIVSDIFGNELYKPYEESESLQDMINAKQTISWHFRSENMKPANYTMDQKIREEYIDKYRSDLQKDRIIPDVAYQYGDEKQYYILDAKYHDIEAKDIDEITYIRNLPGQSGDIYKQYYYAEVVRNLAGVEPVNVFIVPDPDGEENSELLNVKGHNEKIYSSGERRRIYLVYLNTTKAIESILKNNFDVKRNREDLQKKIEDYEKDGND